MRDLRRRTAAGVSRLGAGRQHVDGDGLAYPVNQDVWGIALDGDGNEAWTNGTGPIFFDEATGKYTPAPPELCADYSPALSSELITLLGQSNVVIK